MALKVYYGKVEDDTKKVYRRMSGHRPESIEWHFEGTDNGINWGTDDVPSYNVGKSVLMDAFGVKSCFPDPCVCKSVWVTPELTAAFCKSLLNFKTDESWKLGQVEIVDWAFDNAVIFGDEERIDNPVLV